MEPIAAKALAAVVTAKENVLAIYKDLFQPPLQKLGKAMSNVVEIGELITSPIPWLNQRAQIYYANNLQKYKNQLETKSEEEIIPVPSEIGIPILKRFEYVSNEELSNLFVNLLTNASSVNTVGKAHPGYISIIDRLSPDEAKVLKYMYSVHSIPKVTIKAKFPDSSLLYVVIADETDIEKFVELHFPENKFMYMDNLSSLGLIESIPYHKLELKPRLREIVAKYDKAYENAVATQNQNDKEHTTKSVELHSYMLSHFGDAFVKACLPV